MENSREKILFVAYQFPPRGGAGVQRSVQLVKHLREFGYEPVVLTVNEEDIKRGGYQFDAGLSDLIPKDVLVERTPSYEPVALSRFLTRMRIYRFAWYFFYPFFWERSARWSGKVYPVAADLIRKHNIRLVYTSSGPFSVLELGKKLKEQLGVKWVADLRDPYTDAYAWDFPSKLHWQNRRKFEHRIFPAADKLILNTPSTHQLYLERGLTTSQKSVCITNGY